MFPLVTLLTLLGLSIVLVAQLKRYCSIVLSVKLWGCLLVLPNFGENILTFLPLVKLECSEETEISLMGVSSKTFLGIGDRVC